MTAVFPTNTGARQFYIVKKSIFPRSTRGFPFYISLLKLYMRALCCTSVLKNTISSTYVIFSTAVGTLGHDPPPPPPLLHNVNCVAFSVAVGTLGHDPPPSITQCQRAGLLVQLWVH